MKKLFQKWLLFFVSVAFLLTFAASWSIHSRLAREAAKELLAVSLTDVARRVTTTAANLEAIEALSNGAALAKVRAFARGIAEKPEIMKDMSKLEAIKQELDVDELHVSDERGILVCCVPNHYLGYDMAGDPQSNQFMPALTNANFVLVQEPRVNGTGLFFQYIGIARLGQPGIVQIGYRPERIAEARKLADVEAIASATRIGNNGKLRISKTPPHTKTAIFKEAVEGVPSLCLTEKCGDYYLTASLPEDEMYLSRDSVLWMLIIGNLVLFAVIFFLVSNLLQRVVIKGIYSVNDSLEEITAGNLNEKIAVNTTTEFEVLSNGINATVGALKKSIENEAKRIDAELELGQTIQTSVLPTDFPNTPQLRLFADMCTAKEVGGDFYDFFTIDDTHIAALIADVSGKGITAALFMMTAKTLIKELIQTGKPLAEVIMLANRELCRNNRANMFLTAFMTVLDTTTGELTCVNAGHNPPLLKRAKAPWEYLHIKHGIVLGAMGRAPYTAVTLQLNPGDTLLLYTDGVTEAQNATHELYGEPRLLDALNGTPANTPADIIAHVHASVERYVGTTPQSDDITLLALQYKP